MPRPDDAPALRVSRSHEPIPAAHAFSGKREAGHHEVERTQFYLTCGIAAICIISAFIHIHSWQSCKSFLLGREAQLLGDKQHADELARQLRDELSVLRREMVMLTGEKEKLQKELLSSSLQIAHKKNLLASLKETAAAPQIDKLIAAEQKIDEDFDGFRADLGQVHPDFYRRLQEKAQQKLTALDQKYCACIYMQLSSKQMAAILHVEPRSIQMSKYRLKQKFGLTRSDSLDDFIRGLA
ncbi:hypothetical protein ACWKWU_08270 [Chitinophaga lutea]